MNPFLNLKENCSLIEKRLDYTFKDKDLLILSFVHRSYVNENKRILDTHNERLEFLGDAVLNLIVSEYLYLRFTRANEGKLSLLRSQIVDSTTCADFVKILQIDQFVLLGKGEQMENRGRGSILADLFEAIIGAIYLDGGFERAKEFFLKKFEKEMENYLEIPSKNYKAQLQTYCQKKYMKLPSYKILREEGPDHAKIFEVGVFLDLEEMGMGQGSSKKEAEQEAAKNALENL